MFGDLKVSLAAYFHRLSFTANLLRMQAGLSFSPLKSINFE